MIQDKPWGIGFKRFGELSGSYGGKPDLDAHNHYVLFATEASLIGLVAHLILVLSLWWYGHSYYRLAKRRRNPLGRCLGSGFAFMTVAMILGNIYGSPFANGEVMGLYWILAGLMARHMLILKASLGLAHHQPDIAACTPMDALVVKKRPRRLGRRRRPVIPEAGPPPVAEPG
jgi:O-antigen ligase